MGDIGYFYFTSLCFWNLFQGTCKIHSVITQQLHLTTVTLLRKSKVQESEFFIKIYPLMYRFNKAISV